MGPLVLLGALKPLVTKDSAAAAITAHHTMTRTNTHTHKQKIPSVSEGVRQVSVLPGCSCKVCEGINHTKDYTQTSLPAFFPLVLLGALKPLVTSNCN